MDINTFSQVLVSIVPALSAIATIVGGIIWFARKAERSTKKAVDSIKDKQNQEAKDIAIMKTKIASIEKYLIDKKDGK